MTIQENGGIDHEWMSIDYKDNGWITNEEYGPRFRMIFEGLAIEDVGTYWVDVVFTKPYQ